MAEVENKTTRNVKMKVEYTPSINYAMALNGVTYFDYVDITNGDNTAWQNVKVSLSGEMIATSEVMLDNVPAGETVHITALKLTPDVEKLRQLTESVETSFVVIVSIGDEKAAEEKHGLNLLAFDQWQGTQILPSLLTAFVTPNTPRLSEVLVDAAKHLKNLTGDSALDGYLTQDPNRVRAQVAAIYEALRSQKLVYATPPAGFESGGQRVRLADKVLNEKLGTCLDLTLLYASCLEAVGIHPLLILLRGHIFVGAWLVKNCYSQLVSDDSSFLLKASSDGINEIVMVESTCITSSQDVTFEQAVKEAEDELRDPERVFECFIDVYRCRRDGVKPLPMITDGKQQNDGLKHTNTTTEVKEQTTYDIKIGYDNRNLTRQQIWERKLLDFSLRNNLLNIRVGQRVIPFMSVSLDLLEDKLQAGEDYQIVATPIKKIEPDKNGIYDSTLYKDEFEDIVTDGLEHNQITSYQTTEELKTSLKNIFRASRTAQEENGANSMFLVLGLLKWYDTEKSVKPHYAPIILLPVDLVKKGVNNYVLRLRDEDTMLNTTLVEMMRQQFEINLTDLDPLPTDDSGIDVKKVFAHIRTLLKDKPRWDVTEEAMLGLFSFNKFVMWNDIHNNAEKMKENPIIKSLIEQRILWKEEKPAVDAREVDRNEEPKNYAVPMDVDSSQLEAVIESGEGKSFILYGPPGTGKSQTITNMIANALYHDKRVLFVAEKMAALQVVQKRLKKVGLEPFCLEMHSNKMTKTHLLQQLQMAMDAAHIKSPEQWDVASKELFDQRQKLIGYLESLHRQHSSGLSLYDCITHFEEIDGDEVSVPTEHLSEFSAKTIGEVAEQIASLDTVFKITGHPADSPLLGLDVNDISMDGLSKLKSSIEAVNKLLPAAIAAMKEIKSKFLPDLSQSLASARKAVDIAKQWQSLKTTSAANEKLHNQIEMAYGERIFEHDLASLEAEWQEACGKWFVSKWFAKRNVAKDLKQYSPNISSGNVESLIADLKRHKEQDAKIKATAVELSKASTISAGQLLSTTDAEVESIANGAGAVSTLLSAIEKCGSICSFDILEDESQTNQMETMQSRIPDWLANLDKARDWYQWSVKNKEVRAHHADAAIKYLVDNHTTGTNAADALKKGVYRQLAMKCIDADPSLQVFNGLIFEDAIRKYRELAAQFQDLTKKMVYAHLASKIPSLSIEASNTSEVGKLKRYIASKGRGATIRHIIEQIPELLPKLCPCMLMSPLSVAQFIDLDQEKFDIVVFDEASQMPTSEAVGAIARGKALIVVGDPKQMPPTSFFETTQTNDDEAEVDDMESILDDCITLSFPSRYLEWHYRSKHESLIAFSNQQYYESKLYTFPSVDDRASKVTLVHVDGTYDMGKTRSNRKEAEAIVAEIIRRLQLPDDQQHSIGVVAFSKVQQNLIEDILTEELAKHPELESKAFDVEEPIFVKNLENVQGDERDIILFSIGYGPDNTGKVSMNFGPLNNKGGERRLNVAVSRACYEMMVFTTLKPEQIDLRRSKAKGVEGLKAFLEFADRGRLAMTTDQLQQEGEADIVTDIASELRLKGYEVDTSVGRSNFKIDLAVLNPADKENYLMGILCDGKNYYQTKTVRDREICQPGVLNNLGWNIMRVWSVDWFRDRQVVLERILTNLQQLQNGDSSAEAAAGQQVMPKSKMFSIDEENIVAPENPHQKDYVFAELSVHNVETTIDKMIKQSAKVADDVEKIVSNEQPVTPTYVYKRIADNWKLPRVTDKLRKLVDNGLAKSFKDMSAGTDYPCYWKDASSAIGYEDYRVKSERDIDEIPVIEIMNAMKFAVEQQLNIPAEDLKKQTVKMLGCSRMTQKADSMSQKALENLMSEGILTESEGKIRLA